MIGVERRRLRMKLTPHSLAQWFSPFIEEYTS